MPAIKVALLPILVASSYLLTYVLSILDFYHLISRTSKHYYTFSITNYPLWKHEMFYRFCDNCKILSSLFQALGQYPARPAPAFRLFPRARNHLNLVIGHHQLSLIYSCAFVVL